MSDSRSAAVRTTRADASIRARRYLDTAIRAQRSAGNPILPPIASMARECSVSPMTMWSAVRAMRVRGVLETGRGRGVYVKGSATPDVERPEQYSGAITAAAPHDIMRRFHADIAAVIYPPGQPVPSYKELHQRYGSSYSTLRLCLEALAEEGLIVRNGRGYRMYQRPVVSSHSTLAFIAMVDNMDILSRCTPRSQEFWRCLERELRRLGISLEVYSLERALRAFPATYHARHDRAYIGMFAFAIGMQPQDIETLSVLASRVNQPLALLDENGNQEQYAQFSRNRLCRRFPLYGTEASGREVGRFLAGLGHRRIAYFAWPEDGEREHARECGLRQAFHSLGGEIHRFYTPTAVSRRVYSGSDKEDALLAKRMLGAIEPARKRYLAIDPGHFRVFHLSPYINEARLAAITQPLFESALAKRDVSAWVMFNDRLGMLALNWLAHRGVQVPADLSVVSFDDTVDALGRGLTSYNFNVPAVVQAMLDFVLNDHPGRACAGTAAAGAEVEIPGMIFARASTGCAGTASGNARRRHA